jgi:hypothetical protein
MYSDGDKEVLKTDVSCIYLEWKVMLYYTGQIKVFTIGFGQQGIGNDTDDIMEIVQLFSSNKCLGI